MSVTYKGITFVSIHDAAKFFSEPVWQIEDALNATEEAERDSSLSWGWLMIMCNAIAMAPVLCIALAPKSFLT